MVCTELQIVQSERSKIAGAHAGLGESPSSHAFAWELLLSQNL